MNWGNSRRERQQKTQEIARLRKAVDDRFQGKVSDREWAEFTQRNRNELTHLLQEDLIEEARKQGIAIPEVHFTASVDKYMHRNLTHEGEAWVRHEIKAQRRAEAKDWIAIITPVLSSIIAILGLLVALQKK